MATDEEREAQRRKIQAGRDKLRKVDRSVPAPTSPRSPAGGGGAWGDDSAAASPQPVAPAPPGGTTTRRPDDPFVVERRAATEAIVNEPFTPRRYGRPEGEAPRVTRSPTLGEWRPSFPAPQDEREQRLVDRWIGSQPERNEERNRQSVLNDGVTPFYNGVQEYIFTSMVMDNVPEDSRFKLVDDKVIVSGVQPTNIPNSGGDVSLESLLIQQRRSRDQEPGSSAFIGDMLLMQDALGLIKLDWENVNEDGMPDIIDLTLSGDPIETDWKKLGDHIAAVQGRQETVMDRALNIAVLGKFGALTYGAIKTAEQIPVVRDSVARYRKWEIENIGRHAAAKAEDWGIPVQATTWIETLAVPSTVLFAIPFLTKGQAMGKLSTAQKFNYAGRLAQEGGVMGAADLSSLAWSEGRDVSVLEFQLGFGMGAAGEVGLGMTLPILARGLGATLLKVPGGVRGQYMLKVTGDKILNLMRKPGSRAVREALLTTSTLTRKNFEDLTELTSIPRKSMERTGVGEGGYMLHGTSGSRMLNIAGQEFADTPAGIHLTSSWDEAAIHASTQARLDKEALGEVLSYKIGDDVRLIERGGDEWLRLGADDFETAELPAMLKSKGFGGIIEPEVTIKGKKLAEVKGKDKLVASESVLIFDPADVEFVGRVVDTSNSRPVELATDLFQGKITTADDILVGMDFDQLHKVMDDLISAEVLIPPGTPEEVAAAIAARGAKTIKGADGPMPVGPGSRWVDDVNAMQTSPQWRKLYERISNDHLDRQLMYSATIESMSTPVPRGTFSQMIARLKDNAIISPGVTKKTRNSFLAASFHWETMGEYVNSRALGIQGLLHRTFGKEFMEKSAGEVVPGVVHIGPKPPVGSEYVVGTIFDIIEHPQFYRGLTREMKLLARTWTSLLDADARLTQASGVPLELLNRPYVPHRVADASNAALDAVADTARPSVAGTGAASRAKLRRKYPDMREFAHQLSKHELMAELDPMEVFLQRIVGGARARSQMVYLKGVMRNFGRFDPNPRARARIGEVPLEVPRKHKKPGAKPEGRWFVSREINAEMAQYQSTIALDPSLHAVEQIIDTVRGMLLTLDMSAISIQGYSLFSVSPAKFLKNIGNIVPAMMSRESYMLYMAANAHRFARFTEAGGTLYTSALDIPTRRASTRAQRPILEKIPGVGAFTDSQFGRMLPMMKLYAFEGNVDILRAIRDESLLGRTVGAIPGVKKIPSIEKVFRDIPIFDDMLRRVGGLRGKSDFELERFAADMTNNTGGGVNAAVVGRQPHVLEKFIVLTPGWLRANIGLITQAASVGSPAGVLARRWLMQQLTLTAMLSVPLSLQWTGRMPEFDPRETTFMDIQRPNGSVAVLRGKTYIRTIARLMAGVPWETEGADGEAVARMQTLFHFMEGREGQFPRMAMDLKSGRDFFNRKIESKTNYLVNAMLPIVGGALFTNLQGGKRGWDLFENVMPEFMGVNVIPTSPWVMRDRDVARSSEWRPNGHPFMTLDKQVINKFSDLNPAQKLEYIKYDEGSGHGYGEVIERELDLRESPYTFYREFDVSQQWSIQQAGEWLKNVSEGQPGDRQYYRDRLSTIKTVGFIIKTFMNKELDGGFREPNTLDQTIHDGYYEEVVNKAIDPVSRTLFEAAVANADSAGQYGPLIGQLAGKIDSDLFESLETNYFNMVRDEHGLVALESLKGWLGLNNMEDPVTVAYARDREMLDTGYFANRDAFFTDTNLEEAGLPGNLATEYNSWEEFYVAMQTDVFSQLNGQALPPEWGLRENADGETWYELLGIKNPSDTMNPQQADEAMRKVLAATTGDYVEARTKNGNTYLRANIDELAALDYWEYRPNINEDLEKYLALTGDSGWVPWE